MQLKGVMITDCVRVNVTVLDDYRVDGSFSPDAACDIDYFGYRDTDYQVDSVEFNLGDKWEVAENVDAETIIAMYDSVLLKVQDAIDEQEKENAV